MTLLLSFIVLIFNSLILYVVPEGRVAFWANWNFLGLTKGHWGEQHITIGFLFVFSGMLHIFYNWKPIIAYMKNQARQIKIFTTPFNIAFALVIFVAVGTYYQIPPMSTIVDISSSFKGAAAEKYGEPPYGHAELSSLKMLIQREGGDLGKSLQLLKQAGIQFEGEQDILKNIAIKNGKSPQQIYEIIKPKEVKENNKISHESSASFPDHPQPGWGNKNISDICETYSLNKQKVIDGFAAQGIAIRPESTVKEIAEDNNTTPMAIFEVLRGIEHN